MKPAELAFKAFMIARKQLGPTAKFTKVFPPKSVVPYGPNRQHLIDLGDRWILFEATNEDAPEC